jgi:hypothetical protein
MDDILNWFPKTFGSISGPAAPRPFRGIGGPLTGSVIQALLLGGLGYGAGRLLTPLYSKRMDPHRVGILTGILAGLGGPLGHLLPLSSNIRLMREHPERAKRIGWLRGLNIDPGDPLATYMATGRGFPKRGQFALDPRADPTGGIAAPGEYINPWATSFMEQSSIPLGAMSRMVGASGLNPDYSQPLITTMREAAGGKTRGLVSPASIIQKGMELGVGYLIGKPAMTAVARTLGLVANLPRPTQEKLTRWGTLGIMLGNAFLGGKEYH